MEGFYVKDTGTLANINLFAILRNLEDLCQLDAEAKEIILGKDISIQFIVRDGPKAFLKINDGECKLLKGKGTSNIILYFKSPEHFNQMIDEGKSPILLKGFTKIPFLKNEFTRLTDRLTYYLKPTDQLLEDEAYRRINTILTFYTVFFSIAEIGNHDKIGKLNAKRIANGVVLAGIEEGPTVSLRSNNGYLDAYKGQIDAPRAKMIFKNLEAANLLLTGKQDSYSSIASGNLRMNGYLPMLDHLNHILYQVAFYLK